MTTYDSCYHLGNEAVSPYFQGSAVSLLLQLKSSSFLCWSSYVRKKAWWCSSHWWNLGASMLHLLFKVMAVSIVTPRTRMHDRGVISCSPTRSEILSISFLHIEYYIGLMLCQFLSLEVYSLTISTEEDENKFWIFCRYFALLRERCHSLLCHTKGLC